MRRVISSGSVKGLYLDSQPLLERVRHVSEEAAVKFPELIEVRVFGSIARGDHSGLSDLDLLLVVHSHEKNPLKRMRPYYDFFLDRIQFALDMIVITEPEKSAFEKILDESIILFQKNDRNLFGKNPL